MEVTQSIPNTDPAAEARIKSFLEKTKITPVKEEVKVESKPLQAPEVVVAEEKKPLIGEDKPLPPLAEKTEEEKKAAAEALLTETEKKEKEDKANKEIEDKLREELLLKSIPDFLKDEEPKAEDKKEDKKEPVDEKKYPNEEVEKIKEQYSFYENDPLLKTIAEWRKNGGTDLSEFVKEAGLVDVNKLSVEDLYRAKAKEYDLEGEELAEYVEEQVTKFADLNKVEKKELEKSLRNELGKRMSEKANSIVSKTTNTNTEMQRFYAEESKKATLQLKSLTDGLTEYKGMPIDEKLKKEIFDNVPAAYCEVYDEKGKFLGLDAERGINKFIEEKYRKTLDKTLYKNGWLAGYEAMVSERNRIAQNPSVQTTVQKNTDTLAEVRQRFNREAKGVKN